MMSTQPTYLRAVATPERLGHANAPRLVELDGLGVEIGPSHHLLGEVISIGRSRHCGIQLRQDGQVSRLHCEIRWVHGCWTVRDLGATHRLRVNGEPVTERQLHPGDTLGIGQTRLRFV